MCRAWHFRCASFAGSFNGLLIVTNFVYLLDVKNNNPKKNTMMPEGVKKKIPKDM